MNTKSKKDGFRLFYFCHEYEKKTCICSEVVMDMDMVVRDGGRKLNGYALHVIRRQQNDNAATSFGRISGKIKLPVSRVHIIKIFIIIVLLLLLLLLSVVSHIDNIT